MELVNVCLYGEGYHSGATYEDNIWIKKSSYEKLEDVFPEEEYCGELDGKHGETMGDISIQDHWKTDEQFAKLGMGECDGDYLECGLRDLYDSNNLDWEAEQKEIKEYFDSLDVWEDVTVKIPVSKEAEFYNFVKELTKK